MTRKYFDMIEKVIKSYEALNAVLNHDMPFNDKATRLMIKNRLKSELDECEVTCDETNNPPDIVDACVCVARVMWMTVGYEIKYVDLIFGNPEQIMKNQNILPK